MDAPTVVFALFLAVLGFLLANSRLLLPDSILRERFVRNGILKGASHPDADAPAAFVARLLARERTAALVSGLALLPAVGLVRLLRDPMQALPLMASVAFVGRAVTLVSLGAREARQVTAGPRVTRGRVVTLLDLVPGWAIALLVGVQVAFVVATLLFMDGPTWLPSALSAALFLSPATVAVAVWLAGQPQGDEDAVALAWSTSVRREDIVLILTTSPLLTVVLGSFLLRSPAEEPGVLLRWPADPGSILFWAYFVAAMVAVLVTEAASRRRAAQRLPREEFIDARR